MKIKMKKKIMSLALAAMSIVAFGASAQTASTPSQQAQQECSAQQGKKDGKKSDRKGGRDGDFRKSDRKGPKQQRADLFEGMNLTEAQKTQLKQLGEKQKAARQEQAKAAKESKQRNDSVRFAARLQAKRDYLQEVKAIIGPDQYVVFLENAFVNAGQGQKGMGPKHSKGGKDQAKQGHRDHGQKDKKGQKQDKAGMRQNS